jgi:hypothetical protein
MATTNSRTRQSDASSGTSYFFESIADAVPARSGNRQVRQTHRRSPGKRATVGAFMPPLSQGTLASAVRAGIARDRPEMAAGERLGRGEVDDASRRWPQGVKFGWPLRSAFQKLEAHKRRQAGSSTRYRRRAAATRSKGAGHGCEYGDSGRYKPSFALGDRGSATRLRPRSSTISAEGLRRVSCIPRPNLPRKKTRSRDRNCCTNRNAAED